MCHWLTLRVEVDDVGAREILLDQLDKATSFSYVMSVAALIKDDLLRVAGKNPSNSKYQLIELRVSASKRGDDILNSPLNSWFLAGALEELAGGTYDCVLVVTRFAPEFTNPDGEGAKTILPDRLRKTEDEHAPGRFTPYSSIDAILFTGHRVTPPIIIPSKYLSSIFNIFWHSPTLPDEIRREPSTLRSLVT